VKRINNRVRFSAPARGDCRWLRPNVRPRCRDFGHDDLAPLGRDRVFGSSAADFYRL